MNKKKLLSVVIGLTIGTSLAISYGIIFENPGIGISIGIGVGVAISISLNTLNPKKKRNERI